MVGTNDDRPADRPEDRNAPIHHAVGMLAAQLGWPVTDAFAQLRVYAIASGLTLDDAAGEIVSGAIRMTATRGPGESDDDVLVIRAVDAWPLVAPNAPYAPVTRPRRPARAPHCTTYARPRYAAPHLLTGRGLTGRGLTGRGLTGRGLTAALPGAPDRRWQRCA